MANVVKENEKVKSKKKAFYKRWWFKVFMVIVLLAVFTSNNSDEASEAPEPAPSAEVIEITEPSANVSEEIIESTGEIADESEGYIFGIDDATYMLMLALRENYGDNCEVYNDGKSIIANVWQEGLALEMGLATINEESYKEDWDLLVDYMQELCSTMHEAVNEDLGLDNIPITLNLLNDINKDLTLLSITDGVVFYDWVNMS